MSNTKTVTQEQFDAASEAIQNVWISKGYEIVADAVEPSNLEKDVFAQPSSEELKDLLAESKPADTHNEYSIQDERIWMNLSVEIGGHTLRIPSVEITSIYYAQRKAKGQDERIDVTEVMSLIKTINSHGTDKVNSAATITATFGKQGEKQAEAIDLLG